MERLVEGVSSPLFRESGPEERQERVPAVEARGLSDREVDEEREPLRLVEDRLDIGPIAAAKGDATECPELDPLP
jgi:hypothetical protein